MKQIVTVLAAILLVIGICHEVSAYASGTSYTWGPGVPYYDDGATIHPGTINTGNLIFGDFLGMSQTEPIANYGDSGVSTGWDDAYVGGVGNGNTNGDALDGLWVQSVLPKHSWFDLGFYTRTVAVFTSQDHGPYLYEGLEYRVYGASTLWDTSSLAPQATLTDVYLDGWRPHNPNEDPNGNGWCSDDISAILDLGGSYRYIMLCGWDDLGRGLEEPEVDAVAAPVPEASTLMLMGSGLPGLALWARARRRKAKA
jgi:hypothetical protein